MGLIISTVNMKGGVGKTTLTVNLAGCLAKNYGKKVLVVDLDSQISATLSLMSPHDFAKIRKGRRTLNSLIANAIQPGSRPGIDINDVIYPYICNVPGLDLIPGDIELYDEYLVSEMLHRQALHQGDVAFDQVWNRFERNLIYTMLEPVLNNYDFVILDCAPGYNLLTRSGIAASNFYLLPARPEPLSLVGIQLLERRIKRLKENHQDTNPVTIQLLGIVFILSGNPLLSRYYSKVMKRVQEDFTSIQLFDNKIPMDVNVAKALDSFMPAVLSLPNSAGAKAFINLAEEMMGKLKHFGISTKENPAKINLAKLD